ncbi:MAG: hypothetical protein WAR79_15480 [Melioribacteraceae bacterium]
MKYIKLCLQILILMISIIFNACFDKPDEFVSPTWDVELNIPITKKEFTLLEIVEKDSSFLKSSQDPETLGLIYFGDSQSINTVKIENQLFLNAFETHYSQKLGTVKINIPIPTATNIRVEEWAEDVTSGSTQVFPEQEGNVTLDIEGIKTVEKILLEEGELKLVIFNNLPVDIVLRGILIRNKVDQSIIAERTNSIDNWVKVPKYQIDSLKFPLINVEVSNQLEYVGTIYSIGSNGVEVVIPQESGTTILALFYNLVISGATAPLPSQFVKSTKSIELDDSTFIESAEIASGRASLVFNNNMDVKLQANITFDNLLDENKNKYSLSIPLQRNEKQKIVDINNMNGWNILSNNPGELTNKLTYTFEITTDSTGEVSTIDKNDSLSFDLNFDEIVFKSITGKIKPTPFKIKESEFNLDFGDFDNNLDFQSANFSNAKILLNLETSSNLKFEINGSISSTNGQTSKTIALQNINLPSNSGVDVDISALLSGYSKDLPYNFNLIGGGIINPNYEIGTINSEDSLFGDLNFEIPLNVGFAAATFIDTIDIDLGDLKDDDIEDINYGEVTFDIENTIPVNLIFSAVVMDSNYNEILQLPTSYNETAYLEVPKPIVSDDGEVLSSGKSVQVLKLYNEDIKEFVKHPYMKLLFSFETANTDGKNVKFRTSNKINFCVKAQASFRADFNEVKE